MRKQTTGTDLFTALVGLFGRSRRRYAGYIVHLGIVVMFFGFAGEGFKNELEITMKPGQETTVGHFTVRHDALRVTADAQKQMVTGHVTVFEDGKEIGTMTAGEVVLRQARGGADDRSRDPPRGWARTSTSCSAASRSRTRARSTSITVNPLVNWVWLGLGIMVIGSIVSMLPESMFAVAMAKLPARRGDHGAAAASCCCRRWRMRSTSRIRTS